MGFKDGLYVKFSKDITDPICGSFDVGEEGFLLAADVSLFGCLPVVLVGNLFKIAGYSSVVVTVKA